MFRPYGAAAISTAAPWGRGDAMAKSQTIVAGDTPVVLGAETRTWARSHGTYIAGRAYLDEADLTASEMEAKWGADRLRLLVAPDLREKFDRQRYLLNQAIWHGELEGVRRESQRMVTAWLALDRAATAAGKTKLSPLVWEIAVADPEHPTGEGYVAAIVPTNEHAHLVSADGRKVAVYTLEEISRLLTAMPGVVKAKLTFPGASVVSVKRSIDDPLLSIHDTKEPLDAELGDQAYF
jgi:hypothetical protein